MLISLKQLNQRLFNTPLIDYPYGLAHGKMGLIIYLYHLWSYTNDTNYKDRAEQFLPRRSCGGGGRDDSRHDDVAQLYRRLAFRSDRAVHHAGSLLPRRQD